MELALLAIAALLLGVLAVYAQLGIPRHAASRGASLLTRLALVVTGTALGAVSSTLYPADPVRAVLFFLIGFGVVHFPAACIVFVKHLQRTGGL
ncbi:MAG TPA: hypothetical protein VFO57_01840 [Burkholderiales bacterium]|nr:hypothetical protein [Burkholderiales bacterium]